MASRVEALIALLSVLALAGCGARPDAESAWDAGRFDEAAALYRSIEESASPGDAAAAAVDTALAALCAGDLVAAQAAVERARSADDESARGEFTAGNVAFARARLAARQARSAEAEPFAWELALRFVDEARNRWTRSLLLGADGHGQAAARNIERAEALRSAFDEERRRTASPSRTAPGGEGEPTASGPGDPPPPTLPDTAPSDGPGTGTKAQPDATDPAGHDGPAAASTAVLLRRLRAQERARRSASERARRARSSGTERGW